ncbi:uncharacterized protein CCOS01_04626 [Colletotrichum costaricense]|uniref:Uncharacterized protein n=1 Tax=Colletotrichum costaricense TaxID=1209916 RepID=A0AAI9Z2P3_9PEZI|nr:uncharacterized protein CCOS01_04626 [Colletotrichum costaricense]KAK1532643.1 hypothetical protein CCOS01_04626 [Colletotrichum costaricense]
MGRGLQGQTGSGQRARLPVPLLLPSSGPFSETQRVRYVPTSSACGRPRDTCDWRNDPHRTAVAVNQD